MLYILQTNRSLRSESKVLERIFYHEVTHSVLTWSKIYFNFIGRFPTMVLLGNQRCHLILAILA